MSRVNTAILLGRLGAKPEIKYTQGGTAVVSFGLATTRRQKSRETKEYEDLTVWHRVKAFGREAEIIAEHAKAGHLLYVKGRIDYWEAKSDRGAKLSIAEIIVEHFEFCETPRGHGAPPRRDDSGAEARAPSDRDTGTADDYDGEQGAAAADGDGSRAPIDDLDDLPF